MQSFHHMLLQQQSRVWHAVPPYTSPVSLAAPNRSGGRQGARKKPDKCCLVRLVLEHTNQITTHSYSFIHSLPHFFSSVWPSISARRLVGRKQAGSPARFCFGTSQAESGGAHEPLTQMALFAEPSFTRCIRRVITHNGMVR